MTNVGDQLYVGGNFVSQYRHHPHAPMTAAVGDVLRNTYLHCQHHARPCIMQSYGFETQDLAGDISTSRTILASAAADWAAIAKGWRIIPDEVDYLQAWACFSVYDFSETEVSLRLRVSSDAYVSEDNATATEVINTVVQSTRVVRDGRIVASENELAQLQADYPYTSGFRVRTAVVDVKLSHVDPATPGKCEIRLEIMANKWTGAGYLTPTRIRPLGAVVAWQMRYT